MLGMYILQFVQFYQPDCGDCIGIYLSVSKVEAKIRSENTRIAAGETAVFDQVVSPPKYISVQTGRLSSKFLPITTEGYRA